MRLYNHKRRLLTGRHHCKKMQVDFNSIGIDGFVFSIVKVVSSYKDACAIEKKLVASNLASERCYNKLPIVSLVNKPISQSKRIATYLEDDLLQWVIEQAKKLRINESAFIRQSLAEKMESSDE